MVPPRHMTIRLWISVLIAASVTFVAGAAEVTPPEKFLGFKVGADFRLITYEQVVGYLELLQSQSPRLKVFDAGPTAMNRRMKYAVISSEENLAKLDRYKDIAKTLTLGRGVSEADANRLAEEGKCIVWIDGGLHASEVVGSNQQVQLAYDLVTGEDARAKLIRANTILVLVWENPDGMTLVADWYNKNVGTKYEMAPMPWVYNKYVGHDNNRESQQANMPETQNTHRLVYGEWYPEVYYNQHQTGPFPARIWISPEGEPANPNVHPLVRRIENFLGTAGAKAMEERGLSGVISRVSYDFFYSGSVLGITEAHNIPSILTETQNYGYATPHNYRLSDFPEAYRDLTPGQFYPNPWKGGWWRFADQCLYNETTSLGILEASALYRRDFLLAKWRMATENIERFSKEPPFGWIISANQRDPNATALLLRRLQLEGVEINVSDEPFTHDSVSYPKGSHVVLTSQPYGLWVKDVLERQKLPDLRKYPQLWQGQPRPNRYYDEAKREEILPPLVPYDNAGWTMPLLMGIDSRELTTPVKVAMHQVTEIPVPAGGISGTGTQYAFSRADANSFLAVNRLQKAGARVNAALGAFSLGSTQFPVGTFTVDAASIAAGTLSEIASATHVAFIGGAVTARTALLPKPRIGVYDSWVANMDIGWTRFLFDSYEFPYTRLRDADIKAGDLRAHFDVIILPDQPAESIVNGHEAGSVPAEYAGGITEQGVDNLRSFVEKGGTLICNKASLDLAVRVFRLPVRNAVAAAGGGRAAAGSRDYFVPGSIFKVDFDTSHPIAYGMEARGHALITGAHAFDLVADGADGARPEGAGKAETAERRGDRPAITVVATFPNEPLLESGIAFGEEKVRGKAVVLEAQVGQGRVELFGFNVQNRAQSNATFKLMWNALFTQAAGERATSTAQSGERPKPPAKPDERPKPPPKKRP